MITKKNTLVAAFAAAATIAFAPAADALTLSEAARILAGLDVSEEAADEVGASLVSRYAGRVGSEWEQYDEEIGSPMTEWSLANLDHTPGETIFYPFAGADFVTAHRMYPQAHRYVLVALQPAGPPTDLTVSYEDREAILTFFEGVTDDFGRRGFFITTELNEQFYRGEDLVVDGITPVLMLMAEREGFEVTDVQPIRIADDGSDVELHDGDQGSLRTWRSVRLTLESYDDGHEVILDYIRMDLSDDNLDDNSTDRQWVRNMATNRVMLKAASHLLQYRTFENIRDSILQNAPTVLQEESGLDYAEFVEFFDVELFGEFTDVNNVFADDYNDDDELLQRELIEAYANAGTLPEVPFRIGYRKPAGWALQYGTRSQ